MKTETQSAPNDILQPCPFCGSTEVAIGSSHKKTQWAVICSKCGASCSLYCESEQDAITSWNTRHHPVIIAGVNYRTIPVLDGEPAHDLQIIIDGIRHDHMPMYNGEPAFLDDGGPNPEFDWDGWRPARGKKQ